MKDFRDMACQVLESIGRRMYHKNRDGKLAEILLESQIPIDRDKGFKTF